MMNYDVTKSKSKHSFKIVGGKTQASDKKEYHMRRFSNCITAKTFHAELYCSIYHFVSVYSIIFDSCYMYRIGSQGFS